MAQAAEVMCARPTTSGLGKCTETIKTLVPDDLKQEFILKSRAMEYAAESDSLRDLVITFVPEADAVAKVHADRIRLLAGTVQESD